MIEQIKYLMFNDLDVNELFNRRYLSIDEDLIFLVYGGLSLSFNS